MKTQLALLALVGVASACSGNQWPNGTDTHLTWFPEGSSPIVFYGLTTSDANGNPEYPISLAKPLIITADIDNTKNVYQAGKLTQTINLYSWGGFGNCAWSAVPTFGMLKDLDACTNGVPCPIQLGRQKLPITMDFAKFQDIIKLLKNDAPYQMEMILNDSASGDQTTVMAQARTLTQ